MQRSKAACPHERQNVQALLWLDVTYGRAYIFPTCSGKVLCPKSPGPTLLPMILQLENRDGGFSNLNTGGQGAIGVALATGRHMRQG